MIQIKNQVRLIHLGVVIRDRLEQFFFRGRHTEKEETAVISAPESHYAVSGQPPFDMQREKKGITMGLKRAECVNTSRANDGGVIDTVILNLPVPKTK